MSFYKENFIFKSDLLSPFEPHLSHAFSTREGGVSTLPHTESMNLAFLRGDPDDTVRENFRIFGETLHTVPEHFVIASQQHTTRVVRVTEQHRFRGYTDMSLFGLSEDDGVDAFVTGCPDVCLVIRIADCVPVLFFDPDARVIGAAHAGWRGTLGGITTNTVLEMEKLWARRDRIRAVIGSAIGGCCYEVGEDFYEAFREGAPALAENHIRKSEKPGKYFADIKGMNRQILLEAGLLPHHIDVSPYCTACDPDLFFSHRVTGGKRGTMAAAIVLK